MNNEIKPLVPEDWDVAQTTSQFTDNCENDIRQLLQTARKKAYRAVNAIMTRNNWLIGCRIVLQEQKGEARAEYGAHLIETLSKNLSPEFGGGVSVAQLWNYRQFYVTFQDSQILYTLCRELTWSHIRQIMRLKTEQERNYYIEQSRLGNWSVRELERNIKTKSFKRIVAEQSPTASTPVLQHLKDPYILEFLGVKNDTTVKERKLEQAIIDNMQQFLLELGKGFAFIDRQMHIATQMSDFYIDLVFYNYILKCFVLIDLKTTQLTHQDIGQMDMYVRMFDSLKKQPDDNPTIGLILCAEKDEVVAKYSVLSESKQIFASKYITVLPTEEELAEELDRNRRFLCEKC
jgi:predicted nuclease of restriction endonuclease-like (RecB) superfamily